jgi:hypothetical protein
MKINLNGITMKMMTIEMEMRKMMEKKKMIIIKKTEKT